MAGGNHIDLNPLKWSNNKTKLIMAAGNNIVKEKAEKFAIRIVKCSRFIRDTKREYSLADQLLRCGTSIGANLYEAEFAQSKADFISKMSIALKEASETKYWL